MASTPPPGISAIPIDQEVAQLVNYIRNAWGNHASLTGAAAVSKARRDVAHGGGSGREEVLVDFALLAPYPALIRPGSGAPGRHRQGKQETRSA